MCVCMGFSSCVFVCVFVCACVCVSASLVCVPAKLALIRTVFPMWSL